MIRFVKNYEGLETSGVKHHRRDKVRLLPWQEATLVAKGIAEDATPKPAPKKAKTKAKADGD